MKIDIDQFREIFFAEAGEHLETLESSLLRLDSTPDDGDLLNAIFRSAHTIKGSSGTFGFEDIARFTHVLENVLDQLREGKLQANSKLIGLLLRSCDTLATLVEAAKAKQPAPAETEAILKELKEALPENSPQASAEHKTGDPKNAQLSEYRITFAPSEDLFRQGLDPIFLLQDLGELGELTNVEVDDSRIPKIESLNPETCYLAWKLSLSTTYSIQEIRDVFCFVDESTKVEIELVSPVDNDPFVGTSEKDISTPTEPGAIQSAPGFVVAERRGDRASIRVPIEKIDKLVNLVEELVVTQSILNQFIEVSGQNNGSCLEEIASTMDRNLRELQERVMAVRMVPISSVTGRYPRLVRELSANLGKKIRFEVIGEETELDKQVIEQIGDPLMHLIRNSADHGIDSPEERIAAGKSEEGTIRLTAAQKGDSIVIEVQDDGRGLNLNRIRSKAVERGLIAVDELLTDDQIRELIFHPGFSTAEKVTNVSGRGVGMDVVKSNIQAMKGTVGISSETGHGTRVKIKLPLSVAILDGLCLGVGEDVYILPLLNVTESLRPNRSDIKPMLGKGTVIMVRGKALPLWSLGDLLGVPRSISDPCEGLVVMVEGDGRIYGLLVDEVVGQSQVVVKTIETNFRKISGITGATILGDGRVAMILDVHELSTIAQKWQKSDISISASIGIEHISRHKYHNERHNSQVPHD